LLRGLGFLQERYVVRSGTGLFARKGYLAGPDERRLSEFNEALRDPEARAIVAARGGYGSTRIAHAIDTQALRRHPKWIVGFSDITALHQEALRAGVASLHADNAAGLGRGDAHARARWILSLEQPLAPKTFPGLTVLRSGTAIGPLFGGNLTVLFTCAAAGRLVTPKGGILVLEDIGEAPYRVDRMLSALLVSGALDRVAAVVVGDFTDAPPGRYGVPMEEVLRERLEPLRVPVLAGLAVGHGPQNLPLHFGLRARVDSAAASLVVGESD
jgi:muramoyltetrapeptide carboxypeptidase